MREAPHVSAFAKGIIVRSMHIAPAGDRAVLVTLPGASAARVRSAADGVRTVAGVVAAIVGHESVYVIGTSDVDAVRRAIDSAPVSQTAVTRHHEIEVSFHDAHALDLNEFLSHVGVSRDEFLRRVPGIRLVVRYLGFRAGFAYLEGWPGEWSMPRRSTSRNVVPGGSFAIAASMAGFYPVDLPGGWNILGRTAAPLWENPFAPGDEISIVVSGAPLTSAARAAAVGGAPHGDPVADIITPGQLTTIVAAPDWKRVEYGEPPGGPFDDEAASIANAAVGNPAGAPLLECVLVGPKLRMRKKLRVAFCDADLNVRKFESDDIDVGRLRGMRGYLAIEGGVEGEVRKGGVLCGAPPTTAAAGEVAGAPRVNPKEIRILPGPHDAPPLPEDWEVTPHMNRVGIRLRPLAPMAVKLPTELPSCGAQFGTLQWHADGSVVALGPDHPVTGGYLQPATVISTERWKLAQLAPGDRIKLIAV
ncbi:MAG TPA: carboxyltransferase domain-containing protein [Thermoanaerobaculia bacterium]|nr:carboxyltransferase domain-containing protein [Thermoanaerobaculia bacterium]